MKPTGTRRRRVGAVDASKLADILRHRINDGDTSLKKLVEVVREAQNEASTLRGAKAYSLTGGAPLLVDVLRGQHLDEELKVRLSRH